MDLKRRSRVLCILFPAILSSFSAAFSPLAYGQNFQVTQYKVLGNNLVSDEEVDSILAPFLGTHDGLDGLYEAKDTLENYFASKGYSFYRAVLPNQTLKEGLVQFELVQFKVDQVTVEGNQHFSDQNITRSIPLTIGQSPNTHDLASVLTLANENPSKSVKLNFTASDEPESVAATIKVEDENPQSFYSQINNTGTDDDTEYRLSLGYQNNNLFNLDHSLTLTFTTAPEDTQKVKQWGLNYRVPLYSVGAFLDLLVSDSTVDSGQVADNFEVQGKGSVVSLSFNKPLKSKGNYSHRWIAGISQKEFDDDILLLGNQIGQDISSKPLSLRYQGQWLKPSSHTSYYLAITGNISGGEGNEDTDYAAKRIGADAGWSTLNLGFNFMYKFNAGSLVTLGLDAMISDDALFSGEQFGLGGANSVRGYAERILLGDSGQKLTVEYWSAPFSEQLLRWLLFADIGKVERNEIQVGEADSTEISGYGMGLRWTYKKSASLKLDLAQANENFQVTSAGDSRVHLSFYFRF